MSPKFKIFETFSSIRHKISKRTYRICLFLCVIIALFFLFKDFRYIYSSKFEINKNNFWIFKDSIINNIDSTISYSDSRSTDCRSIYHWSDEIDLNKKENIIVGYDDDNPHFKFYIITIWKIKALKDADLNQMKISMNVPLYQCEIKHFDILDANSDMPVTVKMAKFFRSGLNVDVDNASPVEEISKANSYKGFYGRVRRIVLKKEDGDPMVIFDYGNEPTLFLLYKCPRGFYLIIVNSHRGIDKSILRIFNL